MIVVIVVGRGDCRWGRGFGRRGRNLNNIIFFDIFSTVVAFYIVRHARCQRFREGCRSWRFGGGLGG